MSDEWRVPLGCTRCEPEWELLVHTSAVFVRAANTGLTGYGTWKCVRRMEDRLVRPAARVTGKRHNDTGKFRKTARGARPAKASGMQKAHMAGRREILPT